MTTNFMDRAAKIIAEIRARTCMDDIDAEVIKDMLNRAYEDGYDDGYDIGYGIGYDAGHSAVQE